MYGKYGLYESIDFTPERLGKNKKYFDEYYNIDNKEIPENISKKLLQFPSTYGIIIMQSVFYKRSDYNYEFYKSEGE